MTDLTRHVRLVAVAAGLSLANLTVPTTAAADTVSFADKQLVMVIGFAAGGGTDLAGRLIASYFSKYLPGSPTIVVRNVPGADGMTAMNYVTQQTGPDGLTIVMGSSSQVDPMNYRKANAKYDPTAFPIIGGVGRGGSVLLINKEAERKLYDKSAPPAIMGSNAALPRNAMQMTVWGIEYLGWNARWVVGYPGTVEVISALERGEVDMTATGNALQIQKLLAGGKFKILAQSGNLEGGKFVSRPDFAGAPVFPNQMQGKIGEPQAEKAFAYWTSIMATEKWIGLTPGTPKAIVQTYRDTFQRIAADPEFVEQGKKISEDFSPMPGDDVELLIKTLAATPTEALAFTSELMQKQGLRAGK
jgi:tripartite-type tricarboxylate transporter receptor subunit TctC